MSISFIMEKTDNANLANFMYEGVRAGGSPYFYTWYRWGYGWGFERKYQALSNAEKEQVKTKLSKYFKQHPNGHCESEKK